MATLPSVQTSLLPVLVANLNICSLPIQAPLWEELGGTVEALTEWLGLLGRSLE